MNTLRPVKQAQIIAAICEGASVRAAARQAEVSKNTVAHAEFFFEDADLKAGHLGDLTVLDAHHMPGAKAVFDALVMPKLDDVVDTLTTALCNLDTEVNSPAVLAKLALAYGTCW